jgi:hypothetical protein
MVTLLVLYNLDQQRNTVYDAADLTLHNSFSGTWRYNALGSLQLVAPFSTYVNDVIQQAITSILCSITSIVFSFVQLVC